MCGIHAVVVTIQQQQQQQLDDDDDDNNKQNDNNNNNNDNDSLNNSTSIYNLLHRRGPDSLRTVTLTTTTNNNNDNDNDIPVEIRLSASVLQMRDVLISQPVSIFNDKEVVDDEEIMYLAWNGEIYQIIDDDDDDIIQDVYYNNISDTELVVSYIRNAIIMNNNKSTNTNTCSNSSNNENNNNNNNNNTIAYILANNVFNKFINSEYAFCIITKHTIYYGKDQYYGKRSLLVCNNNNNNNNNNDNIQFAVSSVVDSSNSERSWTEVTPGFVHAYNYQTKQTISIPFGNNNNNNNNSVDIITKIITNHSKDMNTTNTTTTTNNDDDDDDPSIILQELLLQAVKRRCGDSDSDNTSTIGILFSGGLDSTVLAALTLQIVDTVILYTVSFIDNDNDHNNNKNNNNNNNDDTTETEAADAKSALQSYEELKMLYPNKDIQLIHKIITYDNHFIINQKHIKTLIYPKNNVMDINIATALWYAAPNNNTNNKGTGTTTTTSSRILLSGLGADELMGGYGRHKKAYIRGTNNNNNNQFKYFQQELKLDQERLWERNLGRDDRIISDTANEVRYPFLDYYVIQYLQNIHPSYLVIDNNNNNNTNEYIDKYILRTIAKRLGIQYASTATKRAIQFGSRIAHVNDTRTYGSRRKAKTSNNNNKRNK